MGKVYDYPFSDQNGAKTLPDGPAHTYIAYIKEYPGVKSCIVCLKKSSEDIFWDFITILA